MNKVVMYSTATCPYCTMAKKLLDDRNLTYTEIRVDLNDEERDKMIALSGRRTVPQIFIDDVHIGGYDDLYAHFKSSNK